MLRKTNTRSLNADQDFYQPAGICGVAAAVVGGSVVTGLIGANAASNAASSQANAANAASANSLAATRETNALQYQMYQQSLANQSPYMQGGQEAYSALLGAMGLGGINAAGGGGGPTSTSGAPATFSPGGSGSSPTATNNIPGIGTVGVQNYGATQGQLDSSQGAFAGQLSHQFGPADLAAGLAPNYNFQLQQGQQALKASLAATGQLQTGQGLKDINDYAQNQAAGAYQQAFSNYTTQQNNLYNRLQGIIAPGSAAATNAGQAAQSVGANIASNTMGGVNSSNNYLTSAAAAGAAGQVGVTNALTGAINNGVGGYMMNNYLNNQQQTTSAPAGSGYFGGITLK